MSSRESLTALPEPAHRGKVRDVHDLGDRLLLVATDRVSAFDVVLPNPIPDKGRILTGISEYWFSETAALVPNHVISTDAREFPPPFRDVPELRGRSMLVHKAKRIDVECVVRGYIAGGGWKDYQGTGRVSGHALPPGLTKGAKLPSPIFTPSTKEDEGHDEPIDFEQTVGLVGRELATRLRDLSLRLYAHGHEVAERKGFLLADTKFEFGLLDDELILIDEVLTPDSSRYWRAADYRPGEPPDSWDKQVIRDWLDGQDWNKQPPGPDLPASIIHRARERYLDVYRAITGRDLR